MTRLTRSLLTLTFLAAAAPALAQDGARLFSVAQDVHTLNEVRFTSKASIVSFSGHTDQVVGEARVSIQDPAKTSGAVTVDLASLDTGIKLRNEHMQGMLETAKYPKATFKLLTAQLPGNKLVPNQPVVGSALGEMSLHGVTKRITVPFEVTYLPEQDKNYRPGDWAQVSARFKLKMSEYGINVPKPVLGVKIADEIAIEVTSMAKAQ